jgi:hypothetical protein
LEGKVKKIFLAILLLAPALAWAKSKPAPNPADYTITVHVQSSQSVGPQVQLTAHSWGWVQQLTVTIDGKKYELREGNTARADLLRVGDYKAKIATDEAAHPYEYHRVYEFLFADGQTRQYVVVGESE